MTACRTLRNFLHLADLAITDALHGEVTYSRRGVAAPPSSDAAVGQPDGAS